MPEALPFHRFHLEKPIVCSHHVLDSDGVL
jgi:hypothetical protein